MPFLVFASPLVVRAIEPELLLFLAEALECKIGIDHERSRCLDGIAQHVTHRHPAPILQIIHALEQRPLGEALEVLEGTRDVTGCCGEPRLECKPVLEEFGKLALPAKLDVERLCAHDSCLLLQITRHVDPLLLEDCLLVKPGLAS